MNTMKVFRKYKLETVLGEGGMGVVWKAHDVELDRFVALKAIHEKFSLDPELRKRFIDEARIQARLVHQNICTLFDAFEEDRRLYIVQEYVDGITLKKMIEDSHGPLPIDQVIKISQGVLAGLAHAHEEGVIHRDIKPSNIMVDAKGRVKIMDFGIAKALGAERMGKTKTGMTVGTPEYMSPEQILGKEVDARSDIYSFGIMLYEMLTGKLPFDPTSSEFEIQKFHVEKDLPSLDDSCPQNAHFSSIIHFATLKEPHQRPSAQELAASLDGAASSGVSKVPVALPKASCPFPALEAAVREGHKNVFMNLICTASTEQCSNDLIREFMLWCATLPIDWRILCVPLLNSVVTEPAQGSLWSLIGRLFSGKKEHSGEEERFTPDTKLYACTFFYLDLEYENQCLQQLSKFLSNKTHSGIASRIRDAIIRERTLRGMLLLKMRKTNQYIVGGTIAAAILVCLFCASLVVIEDLEQVLGIFPLILCLTLAFLVVLCVCIVFPVKPSTLLPHAHARRLAEFAAHPRFE